MYQNLSIEDSELLLNLMFLEKDPSFSTNELPIACSIIKQRIDVMNLPITFTHCALLSASVFCDSPGKAVVFLIDCLQHFENQTVDLSKICTDLYPFGFYNMDAFINYVEVKIKNKEVKFWHVY